MKATEEFITILTTGLSQQTGVTFQEGKDWMVDLDKKTLYYNKEHLLNQPFDVVRGLLLHEIGHLLFTERIDETTPCVKTYGVKKIHSITNSCEDMRIEGRLIDRFGGYARSSLATIDEWSVNQHLFDHVHDYRELSRLDQFIILLLFRYYADYSSDNIAYGIGYGAERLYVDGYIQVAFFDDEVKKRHRKYKALISAIIEDCYESSTTRHMQQIVEEKLVPIIKDFLEEHKDDKQQPTPTPQLSSGGGGGGAKKKPQSTIIQPGGKSFSPRIEKPRTSNIDHLTEREARALLRPTISTLSHRMRDILKEHEATRYSGHYKRGKLLSRNAYKVAIPNTTRIFSKRIHPDTPKYQVYLALDKSGSMAGLNATYTFLGGVLLRGVADQMKFPIKMYKYDYSAYPIGSLDQYKHVGNGTNDEAVLTQICTDISHTDEEVEKLIFIITDGDTSRSDSFVNLQKNINKKNGTIYGIGIGNGISRDVFKRNYKHSVVVPNVEALPGKLIALLKTIIHR